MDAKDRELRAGARNVVFVDHFEVPFAGFYQNPTNPHILFKDALDQLLRSATFTMDHCMGFPHESSAVIAWSLWPLSGKCSEGVIEGSSDKLDSSMMKPIPPGGYYFIRHCYYCCNITELLEDPLKTSSLGHVKSKVNTGDPIHVMECIH
jgi:hypothetical protein